jgi:hypothetical protein
VPVLPHGREHFGGAAAEVSEGEGDRRAHV